MDVNVVVRELRNCVNRGLLCPGHPRSMPRALRIRTSSFWRAFRLELISHMQELDGYVDLLVVDAFVLELVRTAVFMVPQVMVW